MKKIFYLLVLLIPFASCVSKKGVDLLVASNDSLAMVVDQKDSLINEVFAAMNGIAENLNAIKERENIINTDIGSGEIRKQTPVQIGEDINAIDRLLMENRQTIARLQQNAEQLKKANVQIDGLQKLIVQLNTQINDKDQEIGVLKQTLLNMNIEVAELQERLSGLSAQVSDLVEEKTVLEGEVKTTVDVLNAAYYIVGGEKELLRKEIVYKSGFIGRTVKINENRSLDGFTRIDIRDLDEVLIGQKKAALVSAHPAGSYVFETNSQGVFLSLIITDKARFWEYSKVLVISYK